MPQWAQDAVSTFGYAAVFLLSAIEGLGILVPGETALLVAAALIGAAQMPVQRLFPVRLAACITWPVVLGLLGYYLGQQWTLVDRVIRSFSVLSAAVGAVLIVFAIGFRLHRRVQTPEMTK